jgi:hypothetical protein
MEEDDDNDDDDDDDNNYDNDNNDDDDDDPCIDGKTNLYNNKTNKYTYVKCADQMLFITEMFQLLSRSSSS